MTVISTSPLLFLSSRLLSVGHQAAVSDSTVDLTGSRPGYEHQAKSDYMG